MSIIRLTAILCIYTVFEVAFAQQPYDIGAIENVIEGISENSDYELDYTSLVEDLWYFSENPINLNACTYEELAKLQFLTAFQISSLLEYVRTKGPIVSVHEIQYIYGFNIQLAENLKRFTSVGPAKEKTAINLKKALKYGRHNFFVTGNRTLQQKTGFDAVPDSVLELNPYKSHYAGNPYKIRSRYGFRYSDKLRFGIQAEKDAGEEFFTGNNKNGFDFYSGYLQVSNIGRIKNIILGDYHLQFGQGLTLYSGMAFGKSAFSTDMIKRPVGIRSYTSADENAFFRGVAGTVKIGSFEVSGFFSKKRVDANITDTLDNGNYEFSSFQTSGFHRTPLETQDRKSVRESATGLNIQYRAENLRIGATIVSYTFSGEYNPADKPYNYYIFRGSSLLNTGIDYRYRNRNIEFFGETSYGNDCLATLNGIMFQAGEPVTFTLLYRNFSKGYFAYLNNPFSEFASKNNEQGLYLGTTIFPLKYFSIIAYFDAFKSPWLRYNVNSPAAGRDYLAQVTFSPDRNTEFYIRYKSETKSKNNNSELLPIPVTASYSINKTRLNASYKVYHHISFRNRFELSSLIDEDGSKDMGIYLSHDVVFTPQVLPVSCWLRYALFNCDSYDSRIYAYENSIPYSFSVPFFYNSGMRAYMMVKYSTRLINLWFRYSITKYSNIESIGSGLDKIEGNTKSDVEVMMRLKF